MFSAQLSANSRFGGKKIAFSKAGLWALLGAVNPGRLQKYVPSKGWEVLN